MPAPLSLNQIVLSDLTTTSLGPVSPLALEAVSQHRDRPVIFGAGQLLAAHFAGDKPSLAVAGVAVGVVRGPPERADGAGFFLPAQNAVARDVAPQQVAAVAEPHRS